MSGCDLEVCIRNIMLMLVGATGVSCMYMLKSAGD